MSVKRLASGRWQVRWRDIDHTQRAKTFRTQAIANKFERQVRTDTERGLPTAPGRRLSTAAWASQWLEGTHGLQPRSRALYREALGHVLPELGDIPLHRLTAAHIDHALNTYTVTGAAPSSVNRAYRTLRRMLRIAVERDLILKSPMATVEQPKVPRKEMRFLSADELERLASSIDPRYRSLILVAGWGGLRWGELAGLRIGDVDTQTGQVRVAGQLSTDGRRWKPETKTTGGRRVDLPASVMSELQRECDAQQPADTTGDQPGRRAAGPDDDATGGVRHKDSPYVWTLPRGGPLEHSKFRQRFFVPAVANAGLTPLRIHDLRHTAVALAVAAGAHPAEIQAQLGHTSIKTTLDEYGHIMPTAGRQVAERLETVRSESRRLRVV